MRRYALWFLFCCCLSSTHAQDGQRVKRTIFSGELGAHGVGAAVEWNSPSLFTLETAASYGPSYNVEIFEWFPFLNAFPNYSKAAARFSVNPRFYFTRQRETSASKKQIEQYVGIMYAYITSSFKGNNPPASLMSFHYGLRQQVSPRLLFTAYGGIGWAWNHDTEFRTVYPALNVKVGYVIFR